MGVTGDSYCHAEHPLREEYCIFWGGSVPKTSEPKLAGCVLFLKKEILHFPDVSLDDT